MTKEEIRAYYKRRHAELLDLEQRLNQRSRGLLMGEIVTFLMGLGCIAIRVSVISTNWAWAAAIISLFLYLWIRRKDVINDRQKSWALAQRKAFERELDYLNGNYTNLEDGSEYINPSHPFSFDLDLFGPESLFQRINRTVTQAGHHLLADCLQLTITKTEDTKASIGEMRKDVEWLNRWRAYCQKELVDTHEVSLSLNALCQLHFPKFLHPKILRVVIILDLLGFYLSIILAIAGIVESNLPLWWGVFNFFAAYLLTHSSLKEAHKAVNRVHHQIGTYTQLVKMAANNPFHSPTLREMAENLTHAREGLQQLEGILDRLDSRGNILGLMFLDSLFLWDLRLVIDFQKWIENYSTNTEKWLGDVAQMDAWCSMATFVSNENVLTETEWIEGNKVSIEAKGIWHPFIGEQAVRNDFTIADCNFYIITGANMAGKSTFLRTLGINYVLAMNGLPVFAEQLRMTRFSLFTSMRTSDNLSHGISYFNAELLRLEQLLNYCSNQPILIILDEILKGTNSVDKLNGSRLFLETMAQKNVTGIIATHDLDLAKMETDYPEQFHNYCFEIELGTDVSYSYQISKGVARNQNATFLLRQLLDK